MKNRPSHSYDGIPIFRILRFTFLILMVGLIVSAYYLHTQGSLLEVINIIMVEKVIPFLKVHWYELVVSVTIFSLGFWSGRRSLVIFKHRK